MAAKVLAIDVDGHLTKTICWTPEECENAVVDEEVKKYVNELHREHFIIIYTARRDNLVEPTLKWLRKNGVQFHAISNNKIPADYYCDDRMIDIKKLYLKQKKDGSI